MAPNTGASLPVAGAIRATRSKPQSARVAKTPNSPQTIRYPNVNTIVRTKGWPRRRFWRLIVAKVRIIGAALGSIMPGTIAHQIAILRAKSLAVQGVNVTGKAMSVKPSIAPICR